MSDWYYTQGGQQKGPVTREAIGQLAATGQLRPEDLVWTQGMAAWQPAGQIAGLFPGIAAIPPPIPTQGIAMPYAMPAPYASYPQQRLGDDAGIRMLLPVGRSGWAIAAGYLGLISVLMVPAPFALICSIVAIRDIKRHPDRHGMGRAIFGLIMGLIFTLLLVILIVQGLLNSRHMTVRTYP